MGACFVTDTVVAESANAAWNHLYHQCLREYGEDPYNGSFSTCDFEGVEKTFEGKATKANLSKASKFIEKRSDDCCKWSAYAVDCGVDKYNLVTLKLRKTSGRPVTKFVVVCDDKYEGQMELVFDSLADAKAFAEKIAWDKPDGAVRIQKKAVYPNGRADGFVVEKKVRSLKSKPKTIPKGARLSELHVYMFYAWAAE